MIDNPATEKVQEQCWYSSKDRKDRKYDAGLFRRISAAGLLCYNSHYQDKICYCHISQPFCLADTLTATDSNSSLKHAKYNVSKCICILPTSSSQRLFACIIYSCFIKNYVLILWSFCDSRPLRKYLQWGYKGYRNKTRDALGQRQDRDDLMFFYLKLLYNTYLKHPYIPQNKTSAWPLYQQLWFSKILIIFFCVAWFVLVVDCMRHTANFNEKIWTNVARFFW